MAKIIWDKTGEKFFETGVDRGVLYPQSTGGAYPKGVAWNGLISVTESPSGAEPSPLYADNAKYLSLMSTEEFACGIEAYTYPEEFEACDGSKSLESGVYIGQQARQAFGLSYRTLIGNDVSGDELGYKIHLVYGGLASPSSKAYSTKSDSPEAITFSWDVNTTPVPVTGFKPTATLIIDSTKIDSASLALIEDKLYGGTATEPSLPLPDELIELIG